MVVSLITWKGWSMPDFSTVNYSFPFVIGKYLGGGCTLELYKLPDPHQIFNIFLFYNSMDSWIPVLYNGL